MNSRVIILGGGVAGMSAAHELIERGFDVEIYEWGDVAGGKARSIPVSEPIGRAVMHDLGGRVYEKPFRSRGDRLGVQEKLPWLPGEHGFRFFPGFYKHVVDTMARIPYGNGKVSDNLVDTTQVMFLRYGGDSVLLPSHFPRTPDGLRSVADFVQRIVTGRRSVPLNEVEFFLARGWQLMTSCDERRLDEYEKIAWWDFVRAGERSADYQKYFAHGFTRSLVASQAQLASTYTVGNIYLQMLYDVCDPTVAASDRVLNGPTNDVWIHPWLDYLESQGAKYHFNFDVQSIQCVGGKIRSVTIQNRQDGSKKEVTGDYYIAALPVEQMAPLISRDMTDVDPKLGQLSELAKNVEWMNGMQFYLNHPLPIAHGHVIYVDTPWALTSVSQAQFWTQSLANFSDGDTGEILSVDISDWNSPGHNGKPARECTVLELKEEVWNQLKRSLNVKGREVLRDADLDSWFLDPDIILDPMDKIGFANTEPLLVNLKDTWRLRPEATTGIPNLFLASDYVRTYTDLATMEGANEAARRAVNGIIKASGVDAPLCTLWKLNEPEIFQPLREYDLQRWQAGEPWDDSWLNVGLMVLELVQKSSGLSSGDIRYFASSRAGAGGEQTAINLESDQAEGDAWFLAFKEMFSLVGRPLLPDIGSHDGQAGVSKITALKAPTSGPVTPKRGKVRVTQKL